jgi:hypothetical protein
VLQCVNLQTEKNQALTWKAVCSCCGEQLAAARRSGRGEQPRSWAAMGATEQKRGGVTGSGRARAGAQRRRGGGSRRGTCVPRGEVTGGVGIRGLAASSPAAGVAEAERGEAPALGASSSSAAAAPEVERVKFSGGECNRGGARQGTRGGRLSSPASAAPEEERGVSRRSTRGAWRSGLLASSCGCDSWIIGTRSCCSWSSRHRGRTPFLEAAPSAGVCWRCLGRCSPSVSSRRVRDLRRLGD